MRIFIPTIDYPPIEGGISTVARQTAHALARAGHEVSVLAPHFPEMEAFDAAEPVRVVRFRGYGFGWLRLLPFLCAAWPLARKAELVLAINVSYGGLLGRLLAQHGGPPYLAFAYAYEFLKFKKKPLAGALLRSVYRRSAGVVAISQYTRAQLQFFGVPREHIHIVLPGAPPARDVAPESVAAIRGRLLLEDHPVVLAVGRFIPRKGHLRLVRALARVHEHVPNVHLVMVGRGPTRETCIAVAGEMGIDAFVHCPGYLDDDDLAALYHTCALFALPTGEDEHGQVEGFGLVFAEAASYAKPAVGGRSGGVTDAIVDGETGLLVPPEDGDAIADAIIALLYHPDSARTMGQAGRRRVEKELNWDAFADGALRVAGVARTDALR